ncbi:MAG: MATE family efflux transporter [Bacteroidales bacterium]|nr:MATE family efflux transporter [Bacteroidales bacterium]
MKSLWHDIWEAVKGTEQDFTEGRLGRAILLLSIPMVLEMVFESVFALVDAIFVSRLGSDALAIVGVTESMLTIVYAIGMGLSMATTALVSRRIGEKKHEEANFTAVQAIIVGVAVSLFIAIPGIFFSKGMLGMMKVEQDAIDMGSSYTAIILGSNIIIMLLFIINAIFRSSGDAALSMRVLIIANLINIVLDPCLIFGWGPFPELGIKGAAIATAVGRGMGVLYQLYLLGNGRGRVKVMAKYIKISFKHIWHILELSLGGIGQLLIATSSWLILMRIMAEFGSDAIAGYFLAIRLFVFTLLPSWGMSNAAATLVGQNLGAEKPWRAERAVWVTGKANAVLLGIIGVVFILVPGVLLKPFDANPETLKTGINCLRILAFGFVFYGYGMVMTQAFNGAGDTRTPTIINFFCFWLFEIPLAYILSILLGFGSNGVFISITVAESIIGVVGIILFKRGKWKEMKV